MTSKFNTQVAEVRKEKIDKAMDADAGKVLREMKKDVSAEHSSDMVQIARRIARELAVNGPITIDDVTRRMAESHPVLSGRGRKAQNWKGSVFKTSEWEYIGTTPAQQKSSHARQVKLWATKSWLHDNTLNGENYKVSSFVLSRLYRDFSKDVHKDVRSTCVCLLGQRGLSKSIEQTVKTCGGRVYDVPAVMVPNATGALFMLQGIPLTALK